MVETISLVIRLHPIQVVLPKVIQYFLGILNVVSFGLKLNSDFRSNCFENNLLRNFDSPIKQNVMMTALNVTTMIIKNKKD